MTNNTETNPLLDPEAYFATEFLVMDLASFAQQGGKITRVRWLKEGARYDLSYIHGVLPTGQKVTFRGLPAAFLLYRRELKGELIAWARECRVNAKALGLLDEGNWSILG